MTADPRTSVAFTGHRTYRGGAADALRRTLEAFYDRGFRTFLSGMAVGFDLAAAEAVLEMGRRRAGVRLVAAVPFRGQENRFSPADRERFRRVLAAADAPSRSSPRFTTGAVMPSATTTSSTMPRCWSPGTTVRPAARHYTVRRALGRGMEVVNLHPAAPSLPAFAPTLFG